MPNTFQCPACGGSIEYENSNQAMACPFCGTAVTTPKQAKTVVMPKVEHDPASAAQTIIQQSRFNSSAEVVDEVKRMLREDNKSGATKIYRKEFSTTLADAKTAVDQIEIDMQHSGKETPRENAAPPQSTRSEPAISGDVIFDAAPQKSSSSNGWMIGCGVALVLLCCLCIFVPGVIAAIRAMLGM
jgi:hypothetical protein